MRRCGLLLVPMLAVATATGAAAQSVIERIGEDVGHAPGDVLHVWSAPLRVDSDDLPGILAALGVTVMVGLVDGPIQDFLREQEDRWPGRLLGPVREPRLLGRLGLTSHLMMISGALYASGLAFDSGVLRDAGIGCATADVANTIARHMIGRATGRLRPSGGRGPYTFDPLAAEWEWRSFPGGHAANIMACTSFWNHRFELGPAGTALYAFAVVVGGARVLDEAHWASDVVFGSLFGYAVGRSVAGRFLDRQAEDAAAAGDRFPRVTIGWSVPF